MINLREQIKKLERQIEQKISLLGRLKELERKEKVNCFVCNRIIVPFEKVYIDDTCSKQCRDIARDHSYFDTDGKLKLTALGLNKIK